MSNTRDLTMFYGRFFLNCGRFAVSPYTLTIDAFQTTAENQPRKTEDLVFGIGACLFLTFAVPVLPVFADITFAIAGFAMSCAIASMFVTYPIALICDALQPYQPEAAPPAYPMHP